MDLEYIGFLASKELFQAFISLMMVFLASTYATITSFVSRVGCPICRQIRSIGLLGMAVISFGMFIHGLMAPDLVVVAKAKVWAVVFIAFAVSTIIQLDPARRRAETIIISLILFLAGLWLLKMNYV